ncbi:heparan-alpha-glucosaminide N-acetyltransferase domain-containing protein [Streptomyces sp. NPDC102467]|uniref:heparan-alpha-glucosaminide N-acetyltransferase domain-containing protein n=1 Tax=Streptomyces sp. NPDC102467 TaxID=3366179 RepID=UPI0037F920E3
MSKAERTHRALGGGVPARRPERSRTSRIPGIDVARGVAVLGMCSVHVFDSFDSDDSPSVAWMVAGGRSAATFAVAAGIGLAFTTGGRRPATGRGAAVSVAVRALLITLVGLALSCVTVPTGLDEVGVVLPYYGLLFLLAIPLVSRRPRALACIAAGTAILAPLLIRALARVLTDPGFATDPTFADVVRRPGGLMVELLVFGEYPALAWLAYVCAGVAIGRLKLTSARVAVWLLGGGLALAAAAWGASSLVLFRLGGLRHLWQAEFSDDYSWAEAHDTVLWEPPGGHSWWSLLSRAPHSTSPFDMVHTLGSAVALLGALLLLTRSSAITRLLAPLATAGSMPLTFYTLHVLFLATGVLSDLPYVQYVVMVASALAFTVVWSHTRGRGPLESMITSAAKRARRAAETPAGDRPEP